MRRLNFRWLLARCAGKNATFAVANPSMQELKSYLLEDKMKNPEGAGGR
jgi:hypothetical protein